MFLLAGFATPAQAGDVPGSLVSVQPMPGAPDGAAAYRVLYVSTGLDEKPIEVSGVVIIPATPPPSGGRLILAWAHPTTGIVCRCAPSLARSFFGSIPGLDAMLRQNYVVTATDYPGLGTQQVHPYLVGISEGRAVLDAVRAARLVPGADTGNIFAVWGHSQGGHAALFTGLLAQAYAPELHLAGIAVAAPATDLATLMTDDRGTGGGNNITAMTLWSWSRIYGAPITAVVTPTALPVVNHLAQLCIERWFDMISRRHATRSLKQNFLLVSDPAKIQPWRQLLAENSPGLLPPAIPVFIAQGLSDNLVRPAVTLSYAAGLCRQGSKVQLLLVKGAGHPFIARDAAAAAIAWIAGRFDNQPPPDDCSQLN